MHTAEGFIAPDGVGAVALSHWKHMPPVMVHQIPLIAIYRFLVSAIHSVRCIIMHACMVSK